MDQIQNGPAGKDEAASRFHAEFMPVDHAFQDAVTAAIKAAINDGKAVYDPKVLAGFAAEWIDPTGHGRSDRQAAAARASVALSLAMIADALTVLASAWSPDRERGQ